MDEPVCDIGWVANSIREVRLFWEMVYQTNEVVGYIMLFACFSLVWYALRIWGIRKEEAGLDARAGKSKKARKNK